MRIQKGETYEEYYGAEKANKIKKKLNTFKNHKPNCQCSVCKASRGELKGNKNPNYGKIPSKERIKKQKQSLKKWQDDPTNADQKKEMKRKQQEGKVRFLENLKKEGKYEAYMTEFGQKISNTKKGVPLTEEHKQALSDGHWTKKSGAQKLIDEMSEKKKEGYASGRIESWNKNLTKETDNRVANAGFSQPHSEEWNNNVSIGLQNSEIRKEYYKSEKFKNGCVKGGIVSTSTQFVKPNGPEQFFIDLCKKHNLPYKYVGDGEFWLGYPPRNPDFLNTNGEKTVIEVHGVYWHLLKPQKTNPDLTREIVELEEKSHYSKYDFKCIIIWEDQMSEPQILKKLM